MHLVRKSSRSFWMALTLFGLTSLPASAAVDYCIALDGSSTTTELFQGTLDTIAAEIEDPTVVPQDCGVSFALVQWSGSGEQRVEIPMTEVTTANAATLADDVRNIVQIGGSTDLGSPLAECLSTFSANPENEQSILIITDGVIVIPPSLAQIEAVENAGVDMNVIRFTESDVGPISPVLQIMARPQPASTPPDPGWVISAVGFDEFSDALDLGLSSLAPPECPAGPPPEPEAIPTFSAWGVAFLALLIAGLGVSGLAGRRRRRT